MNTRRQKYKSNRLLGMNQYNAGRVAGYSESYCRDHIDRVEKSAKVGMRDAFEQAGLTDKAIVQHGLEGMKADKVISCNVIAKDGEGMKDANSMTKDFVDVPDWNARHKYFETILRLTDRLKDKSDRSDSTTHLHFISVLMQKAHDIDEYKEDLKTIRKSIRKKVRG